MKRDDSLKTGGGSDPAAGFASADGPGSSPDKLGGGREFDLIRRFYAGSSAEARPDVRIGAGDDCAVVAGDGIVLSVDLSVEDVHFRRDWLSSRDIGYRAAMASLSDLAAMAARPIGVLVSLAVNESDADDFAVELMRGVTEAVGSVGGVLLGGDLTRSPGAVVIDVVAVGQASSPATRGGAAVGDELWVTGELGGSGAAVEAWLRGEQPAEGAIERFGHPQARVRESLWLAARGLVTAMLDISDGIGGDAQHLAKASGVAVVLEAIRLPVHPDARSTEPGDGGLRLALSGGEDYELCFTCAPDRMEPHISSFVEEFGVMLTRVGRIEEGAGVTLEMADGLSVLADGGFQHFRPHQ